MWEIKPKMEIKDRLSLSLAYTPGVGSSCLKIKDNTSEVLELTNKSSSVAVIGYEYSEAEQKAVEYIEKGFTAYPLVIGKDTKVDFILENLEPTFGGFDLSLLGLENKGNFSLKKEENINMADYSLENTSRDSLDLHRKLKGVIKTEKKPTPRKNKPIAIISDGSAVLGFGNIGAEAALPVMEGKSALFKQLGGVDAIPVCIRTQKVEEIVELIQSLIESFSGINLEDISAPRCFEIEKTLIEKTNIPIFHDDQHGTAIVVLAGLLNALKLAKKDISRVKIVLNGAGSAGIAVCKLLLKAGAKNIILCGRKGAIFEGVEDINSAQEEMSKLTNTNKEKGELQDVIKGADVFIGVSVPDVLTEEMVKTMNEKPIVFALANPVPEIMPDKAENAGAFIVATGRSDFKNQINNSLAFPGIFKGVIESNIDKVTDDIKLTCAKAIAELVTNDKLTQDNIMPEALDMIVPQAVSKAVMAMQP